MRIRRSSKQLGVSRRSRRLATVSVTALAASLVTACGGGGSNSITLYNGQHPQLTQALVDAFQKQTGIHVRIRSDDSIILADTIVQEGSNSPADVYLGENSPELMLLTERHLLASLSESITNQIPSQDESPTANWVGIALRVCALVYNPSRISATQLPSSILDLAQPQWRGKLALAPTDSDFPPQVGAVIATHGQRAALNWLKALKANASVYQDEEATVSAVNSGQAAVGIINQYYWYRLQLEVGTTSIHSKLYFFPNRDVGAIENIGGAAVLASSHHKANAEQFVSFLVSAKAQRILSAGDDFEYPSRLGVAANPALPALSAIDPATINVISLGDDLAAAKLIQQAQFT